MAGSWSSRKDASSCVSVLLVGLLCCAACGSDPNAAPPTVLEAHPAVRASSLRSCRGGCDYGEACDEVVVSCSFVDGSCPPQPGDVLCHQVCEGDGRCAIGERCVTRQADQEDYHQIDLCFCADASCRSYSPPVSEGGLSRLREEAPLPLDLFDHDVTIGRRRLIVSGGLTSAGEIPDNSSLLNSTIFAARIGSSGTLAPWREIGTLPEPLRNHATVVVGQRLYVIGGDVETHGVPDAPPPTERIWSARIEGNGRLGGYRAERPLPEGRSRHIALVDGRHVIVLGGDWYHLPEFQPLIWITEVGGDGSLRAFRTVVAPAELHDDGGAVLGRDRLYVVSAKGRIYSLALSALYRPLAPLGLTEDGGGEWRDEGLVPVWHGHPEVTRWAPLQTIRGAVLEDALAYFLNSGAVAIAPFDDAGRLGEFRPATRLHGLTGAFGVAVDRRERAYVLGGYNGYDVLLRNAAVYSVTRQ